MSLGVISAFLLGFWGSLHCVGMCSGIVGVLNGSLAKQNRSDSRRKWLFSLTYNTGRIISYSIAGGIAALIGSTLFTLINPEYAHRIGLMLSGAFMIAFGLYIAGWWFGLNFLEARGAVLWRKISPLTKRFIPVENFRQALLLGGLWGWLPCGLVYSALAWMFTLPTAFHGMLYMAAFGLGTLPMLLLMGGAAERLTRFARKSLTRKTAGVLIIMLGLSTFFGYSPLHSAHHSAHHQHSHH